MREGRRRICRRSSVGRLSRLLLRGPLGSGLGAGRQSGRQSGAPDCLASETGGIGWGQALPLGGGVLDSPASRPLRSRRTGPRRREEGLVAVPNVHLHRGATWSLPTSRPLDTGRGRQLSACVGAAADGAQHRSADRGGDGDGRKRTRRAEGRGGDPRAEIEGGSGSGGGGRRAETETAGRGAAGGGGWRRAGDRVFASACVGVYGLCLPPHLSPRRRPPSVSSFRVDPPSRCPVSVPRLGAPSPCSVSVSAPVRVQRRTCGPRSAAGRRGRPRRPGWAWRGSSSDLSGRDSLQEHMRCSTRRSSNRAVNASPTVPTAFWTRAASRFVPPRGGALDSSQWML
jgi:hypothetical protein